MTPAVVALVCFSIVMLAMGLLTVLIFGLRAAARAGARRAEVAKAPSEGEVPEELVAVLAAAAHAALGRAVKIHRVHVGRFPGQETWSRAGRLDIMVSHRVAPPRPETGSPQ